MHPSYWSSDPRLFVDDTQHPYTCASSREPYVWIRGRQVGGRGLTWGGLMLRFSDHEFRAAERDNVGENWPFTLKELAPFYAHVERFYGVHGSEEKLEQLPDGDFAPPPLLTNTELTFRDEVAASWPERRVIHCRGIPDALSVPEANPAWSPKTVQHRVLPAALSTGRVTIRPNAIVTKILTDSDGTRARGVSFIDRLTHEASELHGAAVVLCASTIESIRLLLNSAGPRHPRGLANSSGCLGRFILDHCGIVLAGSIPGQRTTPPAPLGNAHGFLIPRYRNLGECRADFTRGYGIWGGLGRGRSKAGDDVWTLCAMLEVLPREENSISIDFSRTDAWGIPVPHIDVSYSSNEYSMRDDALQSMREMVKRMGWRASFEKTMAPGNFVHELGGARMGSDPARAVLNEHNQSWDVPNLFVLDGACFVSSGWQNPTLTMLAIAVRACRYIASEFRSGTV